MTEEFPRHELLAGPLDGFGQRVNEHIGVEIESIASDSPE
jgi:hypothetical protein